MTALFAYPDRAKFDKMVSKTKIFSYEKVSPRIRDLFSEQVEKVRWTYKLAPETTNLKSSSNVREVQIFQIQIKVDELSDEILAIIDKAIPFPILFEIVRGDEIWAAATPKFHGQKPSRSYYYSSKEQQGDIRQTIPVVTNLEGLYIQLLRSLMPYTAREGEGLFELHARISEIKKVEKSCESLRVKIGKERQFNLRVALNDALKAKRAELNELIGL